MGDHINANGQFQSDKYPWCRPGFVPLKITDPGAWQPLWDYAEQRRAIDAGFADDLQAVLVAAGFMPTPAEIILPPGSADDPERAKCFEAIQLAVAGHKTGAVMAAEIDSLAGTVAFAARDRKHAGRMIDDIGRDLAKAVDDNWQSIKEQSATAHGTPGHG